MTGPHGRFEGASHPVDEAVPCAIFSFRFSLKGTPVSGSGVFCCAAADRIISAMREQTT